MSVSSHWQIYTMLPNLERIDGCEKNVLTKSRNSSGKGPEEHLRSFVSSHTAPPLCMSESSFGVFCTCAIVVNLHVCDETHNAAVEIMFAVSSLRPFEETRVDEIKLLLLYDVRARELQSCHRRSPTRKREGGDTFHVSASTPHPVLYTGASVNRPSSDTHLDWHRAVRPEVSSRDSEATGHR
ncbi:hypothetical protein F2P81_012000 [Scophthalmus maximus]|uniref:Uncharacterized protein n=1 Tax=Scophthalmus maximus TaxID=52904 RepID=A0A6A4SX54_SCOMX|nr:hypothetical protein F2P81_012000 [Scophthalmus maximus]